MSDYLFELGDELSHDDDLLGAGLFRNADFNVAEPEVLDQVGAFPHDLVSQRTRLNANNAVRGILSITINQTLLEHADCENNK